MAEAEHDKNEKGEDCDELGSDADIGHLIQSVDQFVVEDILVGDFRQEDLEAMLGEILSRGSNVGKGIIVAEVRDIDNSNWAGGSFLDKIASTIIVFRAPGTSMLKGLTLVGVDPDDNEGPEFTFNLLPGTAKVIDLPVGCNGVWVSVDQSKLAPDPSGLDPNQPGEINTEVMICYAIEGFKVRK